MSTSKPPKYNQYDSQMLLNAQPTIITVIDPVSYKAVFQNQKSQAQFGEISGQTCHEKIAGCRTPCSFCKMPEALRTGQITSSEVPMPNDEYLLVHWAKAETVDGGVHIVETISDITELKRRQKQSEILIHKLEETNRELVYLNQQLQDQSVHDSLTGLYNHSYFQDALVLMMAQAQRVGGPLSLLFMDLDDFKMINDSYGHAAGDQVLREMGWLLDSQNMTGEGRRIGRRSDVAARYGGEEFAVILPSTPIEGAMVLAERIRQRVTTLALLPELEKLTTPNLSLTCSIGVASFPLHATIPSDLIIAADAAVYEAKKSGKNCVKVFCSSTAANLASRSAR